MAPDLPPALPAGVVLRDRYRLTSTVRIGHVMTAYRAQELETGRAVAVKVFHEVGRNDRGRIKSFHRPASRRAPSPELADAFVAVHHCDVTDDGQLFLVTELVPGPSVADLLMRKSPLATVRALELATRIGEAVEAALNLGFLDLPLAPEDIIVDDADRVKLTRSDTLILRQLGLGEKLTAAEAPERDPRYASPEELAGLPVTDRSVVYRFGVLLYELLCGSPPFSGTTPAEVRARQLQPLPRRPSDRDLALPTSLDRLVSRMLDPNPAARPADLTSILDELWNATCRLRVEAPATPPDDAGPSASVARAAQRRRPWMQRWALAGLPIIVIGGIVLGWPYLVGGPTSVLAPVRPPLNVSPAPAPVTPAPPVSVPAQIPGFPPRTAFPAPATERPLSPTVDASGSGPSVGGEALVAPGMTQPRGPAPTETKPVSPAVRPVWEALPPGRLAEPPASRGSTGRPEPDSTSARTESTPPKPPEIMVNLPPVRPQPENPRAADPTAIIDWLVR
jgi:hypothetical protein